MSKVIREVLRACIVFGVSNPSLSHISKQHQMTKHKLLTEAPMTSTDPRHWRLNSYLLEDDHAYSFGF